MNVNECKMVCNDILVGNVLKDHTGRQRQTERDRSFRKTYAISLKYDIICYISFYSTLFAIQKHKL